MTADAGTPEPAPPSFLRRHLAANVDDVDLLVGLACDDSMWVRRQALANPATPRWVLDDLVRAGATPDLRGRGEPDVSMPPEDLRRLVEGGPWAQRLVADHPNATAEILDALALHPDVLIRRSVAAHSHTATEAIGRLCVDADERVRELAAEHPHRPDVVVDLIHRADAPDADIDGADLTRLAALGPWGRFLAGRVASCPADVLASVAEDPDWRVRSAVFDNPAAPTELLARVAGVDDPADIGPLRSLSTPMAGTTEAESLVSHPSSEVRLALARHGGAGDAAVAELAVDRVPDVRRAAAGHPRMDPGVLSLLVRAGSTPDLARLAAPDPSITDAELERLSTGGYWARQLAVRHPDTPPGALARLLCDDDPKLREWAAAHPSTPPDVVALLRRAGAAQDFQGIAPPEPDVTADELERVAALGPYGELVASWHPDAPAELRRRRDDEPG